MTLEEAINRFEKLASNYEFNLNMHKNHVMNLSVNDIERMQEYLEENRQLAEWLRELVHLRNITEYLRDMVTCFEFMDSMHYNEDIIEWAESELRVDMREVNTDDSN